MPENNKQVDFARLVDWTEGRLPEDEARIVEDTLAGAGSDTLADAAWLRRFFEATENAVVESPPRELRGALMDTFEAYTRDRRDGGLVRRVLAGFVFDSNLQPAAGLRSVGAQQSRRQLIYQTDTFDLAVNLLARESDNNLDLDGQVLPREGETPELFSVQLVRDGLEMALTVVDEMGSFALWRIPPGAYEMVLSTKRVEISVLPIDVGL